jgi:outer membrane protein assembly factor BamB
MTAAPRAPLVAALACAAASVSLVAADWPQWRGPNRDGLSAETGLLASWPASGPPALWRATGIGEGYSSVAVAAGRVFTQGQRSSRGYVTALDVKSGARLWETALGAAYNESRGNGPRATPTVDGDRVFALGADGTLACLEAASGRIVWTQNVVQKYGGRVISWGMSESPLVDGSRVIVSPGGRGASIVALDKADGALVWKSGNETAGYASAVIGEAGGVRQIITLNDAAAVGVRADTGQQLWRYPRVANSTANIATPIYRDGHVFVSTDYGTGGALLKLGAAGVSEVYFTRNMKNHYSTSVLVGDVVYGFNSSILAAMRFMTGEVLWRDRSVGKGSLAYAEGRLYLLSEDGVVGLAEARPDRYVEVSRFQIPVSRYPTWAPPVIANGVLYIREQDRLLAFDVRARAR